MSVGGQASANSRMTASAQSPKISKVLGNTATTFSMRFSCEKRASRWSKRLSIPSQSPVRLALSMPPNMAGPLVKYSSRLACRSNNRFVMGSTPGPDIGDARADARDIVQDFIDGVEPIVALQQDIS